MHTKTFLKLELGSDCHTSTVALQRIKDAMTAAIINQVGNNGIASNTDPFYQVYESIYLQAHYSLTQHTIAAPEG